MNKTTNGKVIEKWVKTHKGKPAKVTGTKDLLRIRFDDLDTNLEIITWHSFFKIFNENNLAFIYEKGNNTRFCKFISRTEEDSDLSGWKLKEEKLQKTFVLKDFLGAMELANSIATIAQKQNHHPDIFIHDYNKLTIFTSTHEEGKVTQKDEDLANQIDKIKISKKSSTK